MDQPPIRLEGLMAVAAAIESGKREVFRVWIDRERDDPPTRRLQRRCQDKGVRWSPAGRAQLDEWAEGHTHGGIVAEVGPRSFEPVETLLAEVAQRRGWLAMLDGVEDPFNFAHAVRALFAAGCAGLIVGPRDWATHPETPALLGRASAGAFERITIAQAEGVAEAAAAAQAAGLAVIATGQGDEAVAHTTVDLAQPLLLLIGGEKRGVKRSVLREAAAIVTIPYGRPFDGALGTVAAAAVLGFEIARQRVAVSAAR